MSQASLLRLERAQDLNEVGEIGGPGRLEAHFRLPRGMKKAEHARMQGLTGKDDSGVISGLLHRRFGARRLAAASISSIADQRMAEMGEMHANLMGASGFQPALNEGREGFLFRF